MTIQIKFDEKMKYASDGVNITLRDDGRYQCRVTLSYEIDENGKRCNYKYKYIYGVDRNDALIKRAEFIEEQIDKQNEMQISTARLTSKLKEWLYTYKRGQIKPNSFDRLESTYIHQLLPAIEACDLVGIQMKDVTILHIQKIMDYNLERGYSYSTLKKICYILQEFFRFYEDEIPKNPMNKYKLYSKDFVIEKQNSLQSEKAAALEKIALRNKEIEQCGNSKIYITEEEQHLSQMKLKTQTSQNDIHIFSDEDIERIKYVIAHGYRIQFTSRSGNPVTSGLYYPKQGMFFLFMLNSGIRGGEAVCLKYSDFDFEKSTVRIQQTAVNTKVRDKDGIATGARNRTFTRPKTERSYSVLQLSPYAMQIIMDMKAQEPPEYDGYVVHSDYRPIAERTLWQRLDKLLRGAGVQACGLHSLRHTHGTKLYESTQDLKFVAQQLRHTDPSFTAKTYVHQTDKRTKEILENIEI